jgi:D-amino-acid dehydrogenase
VNCLYGQDVLAGAQQRQRRPASLKGPEGGEQWCTLTPWWCAPAWTAAALAAQLGDRVNIYPVKGYSITVNAERRQSQAAAPTVSLLDDETKLVTSRLGADRFRVAGTAEFNGYNKRHPR